PYTGSDSALKIKWGVGKLDALAGIKEVLRRKGESGGIDGVLADAEGYVITPVGDRGFNVVVDGAGVVSASLYNLQGVAVARAEAQGNEVTLEADGVAPGVYVLSIETPNTARIARRILLR
ncbi:MAG: T9SS type A sorting domain-containing protein, partial [Muribaculaceae bacterium]|nr:T9SS type A sorting domain-containing protein [Muribaculaceae bacterium]